MNRNFHEIQTDDATAESFGKDLAWALHLSVNEKNGLYPTTWGTKSAIGLARVIHTILTSPKAD